jgi:hypothetical protein
MESYYLVKTRACGDNLDVFLTRFSRLDPAVFR